MTLLRSMILSAAAAAIVTSAAVMSGHAQRGDLIVFPADYAKGVLYQTVDRADLKQVRLLYASSQAAIDAAKAGKPLPDGTVLTMAQYAAQVDDKGEPVKGPNGRFVRTEKIVGYTVMEKRPGWGKDVPGRDPQRRLAVPGVPDGPHAQPEGAARGLLQMPPAARPPSRISYSRGTASARSRSSQNLP